MFEELFALRGLSLERLKAFVEVAASGGIAKAAPGDPVRQSQFSRQISEIEAFFGVELMRRNGKGMKLTDAGHELMRLVQAHFSALDDFRRGCASQPVPIKIGAGDSLLHGLMIPRAADIQRELSGIQLSFLNLRTDDALRRIKEGSLDFAVIRKEAVPANLRREDLGSITYSLFVPANLMKRDSKPDLAWMLQNLPIASGAQTGHFWNDLSAWMRKHGFQIYPKLCCESFAQAATAVRAGKYAAILPDALGAELDPKAVHRFDGSAFQASKRKLALCWQPRMERLRPALTKTAEALIRHWKIMAKPG